jgi:trimeric autotransporter adhesin
MKTTTPLINTSIGRPRTHSGSSLILIPLVLICFTLLPAPNVFAVVPAPDGGYPGSNTAEGDGALQNLTSGVQNTAIGFAALFSNTTGAHNTAIGFAALVANTTGFENVATGWAALLANTTGFHNTADGFEALLFNTTGNHNTADGDIALLHNTTGNFNTANGAHSLVNNTRGSSNIAVGANAGANLTTGNNNIDIGNAGIAAESQAIRIGTQGTQTRTFIAGISGTAVTGSPVVVNGSGQLAVVASSARYKDRIMPMGKASEAVLALKPVTFQYKKEIDPDGVHQFGLVAEEVEKVNPDLVVRDKEGKPYSVRYDAVNAMLLNEFLKEHRKVEEQETTISKLESHAAKQEATVAQQQAEIRALAESLAEQKAQIQKVSTQLEVSRSALTTVLNSP